MEVTSIIKTHIDIMSKWMKFLAIVSIVFGAVYCATIVGAVVGWFPILLGIWMKKSSESFMKFHGDETAETLEEALRHLKNVFMAYGIATIVSIGFALLYMIVFIALLAAGALSGLDSLI